VGGSDACCTAECWDVQRYDASCFAVGAGVGDCGESRRSRETDLARARLMAGSLVAVALPRMPAISNVWLAQAGEAELHPLPG